jgi:hypothetical protein
MKKAIFPALLCFLMITGADRALAKGEQLYPIIESQYFSVYGYKGLDISAVLQDLDFNYFSQLGAVMKDSGGDPAAMLGNTLDAIYLEVSDSMDIHIYSYHGTINLVSSQDAVSEAFRSIYGRSFQERALYIHSQNTIYVSAHDITLGMLGHEMAHAIMSHYFVVPPPAKVQEVLAGYVEYNLRKKTGTLPGK